MHPASHDLDAQVREQSIRQAVQQPISQAPSPHVSRVRSLQSEESWIDISSRQSTSSLSSAGGDETLTPSRGLDASAFPRRRRRLQRSYGGQTQSSGATFPTLVTDSSQEEYEESESEQDQVMTSSNEDIAHAEASNVTQLRRPLHRVPSSTSSEGPSMASSAEGTTLNVGRQSESRLATSFHPQPNAFTHPTSVPLNAHSYQPETTSYFSTTAPMARAASANAAVMPGHGQQPIPTSTHGARTSSSSSNATIRPRSHTPYNMISPTHNISVDHDAALRASLSTLLSCAAARRGSVPKRETPLRTANIPGQQITQGTLCLVPESELDRESPTLRAEAPSRAGQLETIRQGQVLPTNQTPQQQYQPQSKTLRRKSRSKSPSQKLAGDASSSSIDNPSLSPTTLWILGVGALFLGGAVLFTAGYMQGREVGYVEGLNEASSISCRSEVAADGWRGVGRKGWRSAAGASIWGIS